MNCTNCKKRPPKLNRKLCEVCTVSIAASKNRQNAKLKENGLCIACRQPANALRCQKCSLERSLKKQFGSQELLPQLLQLFETQAGVCQYTGLPLTIGVNAAIDHKQPRAKGGTDEIGNLHWIHYRVNQMKGVMTDCEFRAFLVELKHSLELFL